MYIEVSEIIFVLFRFVCNVLLFCFAVDFPETVRMVLLQKMADIE